MSTIYRKTDKGRAEIEARAHRLSPRLRGALILVDGQRNDEALAALIQRSEDALDELISGGFIEAMPPPAPSAAQSSPAAPAAGAFPASGSPAAQSAAAASPKGAAASAAAGSDFASRQRQAVRMLADAVGPMSEALALRMEKARDDAALRPLLVMARDSIRNVRGAAAAEAFAARFLAS
jgi:hypothetical protein